MLKQQPGRNSWLTIVIVLLVLGFFSIILAGIIGLFISAPSDSISVSGKGNVAVIAINGVILTTDGEPFGEQTAISSDIVKQIEKAKNDAGIRGVLLSIDSPGGSAVASDEISNAIKELRDANKTAAAMIRDTGASGAYWVAVSTEHIIAHPASFTGSIGVRASYLEIADLFEKYGVTYRRLVAGDMKDIGSPYKHMTGEEQAFFQEALDDLHSIFIQHVADSRKMPFEDVKKLATGAFYTGKKAKELGLVDELGSEKEAKAYFKEKLKADIKLVEYKKPKSLLQLLAESLSGQSFRVGQGIGYALKDSMVGNEMIVRV